MTDREATDAEMLAAVERWAKSRGFTRNRGSAWCVDAIAMQTGHRSGLLIQRRGSDSKYSEAWENVDPHTALLWACTVETTETLTSPPMRSDDEAHAWVLARTLDPTSTFYTFDDEPRGVVATMTRPLAVDVGRCPACVARSLPGRKSATVEWWWTWERSGVGLEIVRERMSRDGWRVERVLVRQTGRRRAIVASRPCPDCNGTGRDMREVARLVLDAAEAVSEWTRYGAHVLAWMYLDEGGAWREEGMPARLYDLRDALHVAADQLQVSGEHLGTWHALGLAGKDDAAGEMVAWLHERPPATADPYYGEISGTVLR